MNPFLRFMKKLSPLFGRGRFRSDLELEMAFHRGRRAIATVEEGARQAM